MPVKFRLKNPKFQTLAEALFEAVNTCRAYNGVCSVCSESERRGVGYACKPGLNSVKEARQIKRSRIVNEAFVDTLHVYASNYTGHEAGDVYENSLLRLIYPTKKLKLFQ